MIARGVELGTVCEITMGQAPSGETYNDVGRGVPLIAGASDFGGAGRPEAKRHTSEPNKMCQPGDIVLSIRATIGTKVLSDSEYCLGRGVAGLRAKHKLSERYLWHWLSHAEPALSRKGRGATFPQVSRQDIAELNIPLPTLNEQQRIASILDEVDALRRKRKCALELLDGLTQSIFLEMFGDPIANPNRLPTTCLQDVVSADRKITYGILKPGPDITDGIPYVRVVDIRNSMINIENLKRTSVAISCEYRRSTLKAGDLLISIRGHVGRMAIAPIECAGANITQDTARLAVDGADTEFVKAQLETKAAQDWMARRTKGAAVKGINLGDLKLFPLLLPPLDAQREFSRRIKRLRRMTVSANRQLHDLETLLASLYHRAFSWQL